MIKILFLLLISPLLFSTLSQAAYPIPDYELVVVESLPETMNLNMSLRQIEDAKHASQLQKSKSFIYDVLTQKLSPLLNNQAFIDGYNLFELAKNIPTVEIVDALIEKQNSESKINLPPVKFMALILPKMPAGSEKYNKLPYSTFYSQSKATVIDDSRFGFKPEMSFSELINERISDSIQFSFENNYEGGTHQEAFFVGAMLLINLEGENTSLKFQLIGGLPTDLEYEVNLEQPEASFKYFRFPKTPEKRMFSDQYTDYPGVILTLNYKKNDPNPLLLKIQFGSLSLVGESELLAEKSPQTYAELFVGWKEEAGVIFKRYNVPHLFGSEFAPIGKVILNDLTRDIQVNIHEIELNLITFEVIRMRVIVEFPPKTIWGGWNLAHDFMPRIEQPALNEKFKDAVNAQLEPYREKLNLIKTEISNNGLVGLIDNPELNSDILEILNKMLENKTKGQQ